MNYSTIKSLPAVQKALSPAFSRLLYDNAPRDSGYLIVNYYSAYISTFKNAGYEALDILSNHELLLKQLRGFVGFIYSYLDCKRAYEVTRIVFKAFGALAKREIIMPQIPSTKINKFTKQCIDMFMSEQVSTERIEYLDGWQLKSKEGKLFNFPIGEFHEVFGDELTSEFYFHTCQYCKTQKRTTLPLTIYLLSALLNSFTRHCNSADDLLAQLKANKLSPFLEKVMWCLFSEHLARGNKSEVFFIFWTKVVKVFKICFIESRFIDEPIRPILTPTFKVDSHPIANIATGGKFTDLEEQLWLASIPLHIKDELAVQVIEDRLRASEEHIRASYHPIFERIKRKHKRNRKLAKKGMVKPISTDTGCYKKAAHVRVGRDHLENSIATFYEHGIGAAIANPTAFYGGNYPNSDRLLFHELADEFNLPTTATLGALCTLLVLEHPVLTPSALENWELFDKNEKITGYKQVGSDYIIVVNKARKGSAKAQQDIILNKYSRAIVKTLIDHTGFTRQYLKANPSTDKYQGNAWRYMLLKTNLRKASWECSLGSLITSASISSNYRQWVFNHSSGMNEDDKLLLSKLVGLRSSRKIRAVRTYIETHSLRAVAEVLGHETVNVDLLKKYLPSALMDFFNARWIRQFQNALIYIAMQESDYLFEAIDIKPEDLDEFLHNHGVHDIL